MPPSAEPRKQPSAVLSAPVKCALNVAEHLSGEQRTVDYGAIDGDKGPLARRLWACVARAINSLPVPVGPVISTVDDRAATRRISFRISVAHEEIPTALLTEASGMLSSPATGLCPLSLKRTVGSAAFHGDGTAMVLIALVGFGTLGQTRPQACQLPNFTNAENPPDGCASGDNSRYML